MPQTPRRRALPKRFANKLEVTTRIPGASIIDLSLNNDTILANSQSSTTTMAADEAPIDIAESLLSQSGALFQSATQSAREQCIAWSTEMVYTLFAKLLEQQEKGKK